MLGDGTSDHMSFFFCSVPFVPSMYYLPRWEKVHCGSMEGRVFEKIAEKLQWGSKAHRGGQPSKWSDMGPSVGCIDCSLFSLDPSL